MTSTYRLRLFPATIIGNASSTRTGWAAGAGAEYVFWSSWSVKLEWLHYDLGSPSIFAPRVNGSVVRPFGLDGRIVTKGALFGRLTYKFGGPRYEGLMPSMSLVAAFTPERHE